MNRTALLAAAAAISLAVATPAFAQSSPALDTVPLQLLSAGETQDVTVRWVRQLHAAATGTSTRVVHQSTCSTPCEVFVPPGRVLLASRGADVAAATDGVQVTSDGARVRLRAPSAAVEVAAGGLGTTGGALLTVGGAMFVAPGLAETSTIAVGPWFLTVGVIAATGLVALIPSLILRAVNAGGVASVTRFDHGTAPHRTMVL